MPRRRSIFNSDLQIIYVLCGSCILKGKNHYYQLNENGYCFIDPFTEGFIAIENRDDSVLVFHIPQKFLKNRRIGGNDTAVSYYYPGEIASVTRDPNPVHIALSSLFRILFYSGGFNKAAFVNGISELFSSLTEEHGSEAGKYESKKRSDSGTRLISIDSYLREHLRDELSLDEIAAHEYLSPNYLSHYFSRHTGLSLFRYIDVLRLSNTASDLIQKDLTVTEIANRNGFRNVNYFIQKFREYYEITPKKYAKLYAHHHDESVSETTHTDPDQSMVRFLSYSETSEIVSSSPTAVQREREAVSIDFLQNGVPLRHTWRKLLNIGYAKEGLYANVQSQILRAQKEIGYEYIRFHGILDDDMYIYRKGSSGKDHLSFSHVDMLLDFIRSADLKPYIELSYMPGILAQKRSSHFDRSSYSSVYKDPDKWRLIIRELLLHCIERYGRESVQNWRFTSFGLSLVATGLITYDNFFEVYSTSYHTVKEIDPKLMFGGPGDMSSSIWENRIMYRFLEDAKKDNCVPDFITVQNYPYTGISKDNEFLSYSFSQVSAPSVLSGNENYTSSLLAAYTGFLQEQGLEDKEIWFDEWNSTLWQRDISSDSCYKSAWLVKNICENYDKAGAFGYWNLSDFMEERAFFGSVYHGGYGLFTYNGIPKSGWLALQLVRKLGDECIYRDKGCFITKGDKSDIRILLYNYAHYDNLYRYRYEILDDPRNAYMVFQRKAEEKRSFIITNLASGKYRLRSYSITPEHGSSFDSWIRLGMPAYLNDDEYKYLSNISVPKYRTEMIEISGDYQTDYSLQVHEVRLIILEKCS